MVPVILEDLLHLLADPIYHKNLHACLPVKSVVGLPKAEEDLVGDLLPHFRKLLKQLGSERGGPCSLIRPEAMYYIITLKTHPGPPIDDPRQRLP